MRSVLNAVLRHLRPNGNDPLAEVKANVRDDLVALCEDIRDLEVEMQLDITPDSAKEAYAEALAAHDRAMPACEQARIPDDLQVVGAALEEGRYAMLVATARLEERPPPARRPPCFFDPRHGPSSREVAWTRPDGAPRPVPACEPDAQRIERGETPRVREVSVDGRRMPYWSAGPTYAPFMRGFFGGREV